MTQSRIVCCLLFLPVLLLCAVGSKAAEKPAVTSVPPPQDILFVGNSFTFYNNGLHNHLGMMMQATGRERGTLRSMTISGAALSDHAAGLPAILEANTWDVVILQGNSMEPIDKNRVDGFRQAVRDYAPLIRKSGAQPVLFMTWSRTHLPEQIVPLHDSYTAAGNETGTLVVPVGHAFDRLSRQRDDIVLRMDDRRHPTLAGAYLATCTFMQRFFTGPRLESRTQPDWMSIPRVPCNSSPHKLFPNTMASIWMKLTENFYLRDDVVQVSRDLLGKVLCTKFDGVVTSVAITETEAYAGTTDKASHAYGDRRTKRTEPIYGPGGHAYVYLCYGIHHLFNVVTNVEGVPHAVLIRAGQPLDGVDEMLGRRNKQGIDKTFLAGPGSTAQALGITTAMTGISLQSDAVWIEDRVLAVNEASIQVGPRIGIDYAEEDAELPYRFVASELRLD